MGLTCIIAVDVINIHAMLVELGHLLLIASAVCALSLTCVCLLTHSHPVLGKHFRALVRLHSNTLMLCLTASFLILIHAFIICDYSVTLVWENCHDALPIWYKTTAVWGNHKGSWLLWTLLCACSLWFFQHQLPKSRLSCYRLSLASASVTILSLLAFSLFTENPFRRLWPIPPPQGLDLNPLLQDPLFTVHPPVLFMGNSSTLILFCIALQVAILPPASWRSYLRFWTLWSWSWQSLGIALGSMWAYKELGWGGWWFWDPVENCALVPWLLTTSLLHALKSCDEHNRNWVVLHALSIFLSVLLGLFMVRSGLLVSVHAFATSGQTRTWLAIILALHCIIATAVWLWRKQSSINKRGSSTRTHWLQLQTLIFSTTALWITTATLAPNLQALFGTAENTITVGSEYFETFIWPLWLLAIVMLGLNQGGRLNKHQHTAVLVTSLLFTTIVILAVMLVSPSALNTHLLISLWASVWLCCQTATAFASKGIPKLQIESSAAHLLFALLGLCVLCNSVFEQTYHSIMQVGTPVTHEHLKLTLHTTTEYPMANHRIKEASLIVYNTKTGQTALLKPTIRQFSNHDISHSQAFIQSDWLGDTYATLSEPSPGLYQLRLYYKPLQRWIWLSMMAYALLGFSLCYQYSQSLSIRFSQAPLRNKQQHVYA